MESILFNRKITLCSAFWSLEVKDGKSRNRERWLGWARRHRTQWVQNMRSLSPPTSGLVERKRLRDAFVLARDNRGIAVVTSNMGKVKERRSKKNKQPLQC